MILSILIALKYTILAAAICNFTSDTIKFEELYRIGDSMEIDKE